MPRCVFRIYMPARATQHLLQHRGRAMAALMCVGLMLHSSNLQHAAADTTSTLSASHYLRVILSSASTNSSRVVDCRASPSTTPSSSSTLPPSSPPSSGSPSHTPFQCPRHSPEPLSTLTASPMLAPSPLLSLPPPSPSPPSPFPSPPSPLSPLHPSPSPPSPSASPPLPSPAPSPPSPSARPPLPSPSPSPPSPSASPPPPSPSPSPTSPSASRPPPSPSPSPNPPSPSPSPSPPIRLFLPSPSPPSPSPLVLPPPSSLNPPPPLHPSPSSPNLSSPSLSPTTSTNAPSPPTQPIMGGGSPVVTLPATGMVVPGNLCPVAPAGQRFVGVQNINLQVKSAYEIVPLLTNVVAVHLMQVPGTNTYLYLERPSGYHPTMSPPVPVNRIAGTLNLDTLAWNGVISPDGLFCAGHTVTATGQVLIVGGHRDNAGYPSGMKSVRVYDIKADPTQLIHTTSMSWNRWYPSPTLLPTGRVLIMGGTQGVGAGTEGNPTYEIFDPRNPTQFPLPQFDVDPGYLSTVKQNYYPFNYVLPTSELFNFCNRIGRIMLPETGVYRDVSVPTRPGEFNSQFPYTATSVMLALRPEDNYSVAEFMLFGGAPHVAVTPETVVAGRLSHRMRLRWSKAPNGTWDYDFQAGGWGEEWGGPGGWAQEDMGIPRVMGDATLLPNGDVILLNGAQEGVAGDAAVGGGARANYPALWAQLYQPDLPRGQRYTTLAASTIARHYHSTACLTTNGTILVAGCDRCGNLLSDVDFMSAPSVKAEYRSEIFYPPYFYDMVNKPRILTVNGDTSPSNVLVLGYNEAFIISWGSELANSIGIPPLTSVSIVAASSTTHSFNFNQRVVFLPMTNIDNRAGVVQLLTPPNPFVAVPQFYMVFLLNGKTYSSARWIQLIDKDNVAQPRS